MKSIPMSKAQTGTFRVAAIVAPGDLVARLSELGLRVGSEVSVMDNRGPDGMLVGVGDARLALDRDAAARVRLVAANEVG